MYGTSDWMDYQSVRVTDLIAAANNGDAEAWDEIVARYASLVWSVCRCFHLSDAEAADVSQTIWLRLVERLSTIRTPEALPGWLKTTTRNECLRVLAVHKRTPFHLDDSILHERVDEQGDQAAIDAELLAAERRAVVRECLAQLKPRCRDLLIALSQDDKRPYSEVSSDLGMPLGSIGPTRQRCLEKLRNCPALRRWASLDDNDEGGDPSV